MAILKRWLVGILLCIPFLGGCTSVRFTSPVLEEFGSDAAPRWYPEVPESAAVVPVLAPELARGSRYQYGRFMVEVAADGSQTIEGGVFTPVARPPLPLQEKHTIFVDYTRKELTYYRKIEGGAVEPVVGYAVVTPSPALLPSVMVVGRVTAIDTAPTWCPTPNIRMVYPELPAGCLPFGHPENAMGAAKFIIDWKVPKTVRSAWATIRLHGASGYPSGSFWGEETFGCVRLVDAGIIELIKALGPQAIRDGLEVVLLRRAS